MASSSSGAGERARTMDGSPAKYKDKAPASLSFRNSKGQQPFQLLRRTSMIVADTGERVTRPLFSPDIRKRPKLSRTRPLAEEEEGDDGYFGLTRRNDMGNIHHEDNSNESAIEEELTRLPKPRWLESINFTWHQRAMRKVKAVLKNDKVRNVLKCSIGYFFASLAVYTSLGNIYGRSDNKHLIATTVVYFSPGRSIGSMIEATLFAFLSLAYGLFCAYLSMMVSMGFVKLDLRYIGYGIDILLFCAVGLGVVAFMKQKVNKPTFSTACSLASIFLITILTKEGFVQAGILSMRGLFQSFFFCLTGVLISSTICLVLWPKSSITQLKATLNKSTDLYSNMLDYISETFINGDNVNTDKFGELNLLISRCFNDLDNQLSVSKYELYITGREKEFPLLSRLVDSNHRLALLMGGLKSSAITQQHMLNDEDDESSGENSDSSSIDSFNHIVQHYSHDTLTDLHRYTDTNETSQAATVRELFQLFVYHLGPPLRSFSYTMRGILDGVPFGDAPDYPVSVKSQFRKSLALATTLYSQARERALVNLYGQDIFQTERDFDAAADEEGVAASCGNFSYVLEAFGNELTIFLEELEQYDQVVENDRRSFNWLKFWQKRTDDDKLPEWVNDEDTYIYHTGTITNKNKNPFDLKNEFSSNLKTYNSSRRNAPLNLRIWRSLHAFRRTDVQFGIKVGVGAAIFAIPAFLDHLRPLFGLWRGEWGLITYAIIMNKSVGGTTKTVPYRIVGTFLGAFLAFISWTLFPEQEYILATIGFLLCLPCFYIVLYWKDNNPFGRFILLTFNLTALYSYSLTANDNEQGDDDEGGIHPIVKDIAFHRFVSVFIGIIWALFITVLIMPNTARRKLRQVLSVQWLRMGLLWKADPFRVEGKQPKPRTYSSGNDGRVGTSTSLTAPQQASLSGIQGENFLQTTMIELNTLLSQAPLEFRLKGPFPVSEYKLILASTQQILDAFQNMSVLISKYRAPSKREMELIEYTSQERKELSSRIFLFFYLASSAVKLGFPLPDKLPSTEHAIDRMLAKLNEFRIQQNPSITETGGGEDDDGDDAGNSGDNLNEEDFVLFYSYILVTITISEELAKIALYIQNIFGVIEDELFETS